MAVTTRIVVTIMLMGAMVLTCITGGIIWRLATKDAAVVTIESGKGTQRVSKVVSERGAATLISLPRKCAGLYNVGRHREWADCMGVEYR